MFLGTTPNKLLKASKSHVVDFFRTGRGSESSNGFPLNKESKVMNRK